MEKKKTFGLFYFFNISYWVKHILYYFYQNRQNKKLKYLNYIFSLMPFLGFCSLFIGKIFTFLRFNGTMFLFFSWLIFGVLFILFYKKKDMDFTLINYKKIDNPGDYLNYALCT